METGKFTIFSHHSLPQISVPPVLQFCNFYSWLISTKYINNSMPGSKYLTVSSLLCQDQESILFRPHWNPPIRRYFDMFWPMFLWYLMGQMSTFAERAFNLTRSAAVSFATSMAWNVGIFQALIDATSPLTSQQVAQAKGLKERLEAPWFLIILIKWASNSANEINLWNCLPRLCFIGNLCQDLLDLRYGMFGEC